ncbi:Hemolysin-type calcium-binding region [Labilithrix luteola]|uniref:Hemolysin-type calcium-binding region n=1 Tax=Labilithrix luteola TaxID=1391654 RepID=A0A0K1QBE8_9BACT|nr:lamin tail domain-containing protein [Labilithrix luteola]AKV03074.1 Hemolysin-type calcium-binding region [Labilithrix luteola]
MSRSLRALALSRTVATSVMLASSVAASVAVALALALGGAACANSPQPDLTPDYDPSLPTVDASLESHPVVGNSGDDSSSSGETTGGAKKDASAPAANANDAGSTKTPSTPSVTTPAAGEILITEVMYTTLTPEPMSEWFEVYNLASAARTLSGLKITDGGGRSHVIGAGVTLGAGEYGVLVRDKATAIANAVPASAILYEYGAGLSSSSGVILANGASGGIALYDASVRLANVPYGGWFSQSGGSSIQLKSLTGATSDSAAGWCLSATAWTSGSAKGTPGAASDCP